MLKSTLSLLLLLNCKFSFAQCDSAAVREWLRNMNPDTVCIPMIGECPAHGCQSCIRYMFDSTRFSYQYRDSVTGLYSVKIYYNNRVTEHEYNTVGDTIVYMHYENNSCNAYIIIKLLVNDSATRADKKQRTFYDYYSEMVYDTSGNVEASWIETIVIKRGKKFRRTVYTRPNRKFNKVKVRMKRV